MTKRKIKKRNAHLKSIARAGGLARMQQLRDNGQLKSFQSLGAKTMMAKHGKAKLIAKVAAWRRSHHSGPECELHQILDSLGVFVSTRLYDPSEVYPPTRAFIEHQPFPDDDTRPYILDVAWPALKIYLEVDGPVHTIFTSPERQMYEMMREVVLTEAGWKGFKISSGDLHSDYGMSVIMECVELVKIMASMSSPEIAFDPDTIKTTRPYIMDYKLHFNLDDVPF